MGLSIGLIHKQEVSQKQYSSVFWVNLSLSIVLYLFLVAMSPLFADFYAQNELKTLIPLMGVQLIINAFGKMFYTFKTKIWNLSSFPLLVLSEFILEQL